MDQALLKQVFDENYTKLVLFANQYIYQEAEAEDIVQEAFVKLWHKREDLKNDKVESLRSYLYQTVRNKALNYLKHHQVKEAYQHQLDPAAVQYSLMNTILQTEVLVEIHKAIEELPVECQKVAKELFIQGKKYTEVAEELSISINTVKSQRKRALTLLRPRLSDVAFSWLL
ncbi:RNA polymerase sigma-70 factor [Echinicola sediminis]